MGYDRTIIIDTFADFGIEVTADNVPSKHEAESISVIKEKFNDASSMTNLLEGYVNFAVAYCEDERKGVQSLVKRAIKSVTDIVNEQKRVHELYRKQDEIAGGKLAVGLDEVGRGPLAGPLTIGAVVLDYSREEIQGINDSKQLSAAKRENLSDAIKKSAIAYSIQHIAPSEIDSIGMSACLRKAFSAAISDIDEQIAKTGTSPVEVVLLDGNPLHLDDREINIVKGDATCAAISCASIIAKVERDQIMIDEAKNYPGYGWEHNAGYGSPDHIEKIKSDGLTPLHRKSFCKNFV